MMRTDSNNNPVAFTTDIAKQAGLTIGKDYTQGDSFKVGAQTFYTARLLGDPIEITVRVITSIGFYTNKGAQRWTYISVPRFLWLQLSPEQRRDVIGFMYQYEGGTAMRSLFPNYGRL